MNKVAGFGANAPRQLIEIRCSNRFVFLISQFLKNRQRLLEASAGFERFFQFRIRRPLISGHKDFIGTASKLARKRVIGFLSLGAIVADCSKTNAICGWHTE
jgi:hypothetical protein